MFVTWIFFSFFFFLSSSVKVRKKIGNQKRTENEGEDTQLDLCKKKNRKCAFMRNIKMKFFFINYIKIFQKIHLEGFLHHKIFFD
jgi:hypothetical protein